MTPARRAREYAISFEARKDGLTQNDTKGVVLRLQVHPAECPPDLLTAPVGSRFICSLVSVGDMEEPQPAQYQEEGKRSLASSQLLCRDFEFQKYIIGVAGGREDVSEEDRESEAADCLKAIVGIRSRSEIVDDPQARREFHALRDRFETWKRRKR